MDRGVSAEQWLAAALKVFRERGVEAVKVAVIAEQLGVAKSGAYYHFESRQGLLDAIFRYWERESTVEILSRFEGLEDGAEKLSAVAEHVIKLGWNEYDLAIAGWATRCVIVREKLKQTRRARKRWVKRQFEACGFAGKDLEVRVRLYCAWLTWDWTTEVDYRPYATRKLVRPLVELLMHN